MAFGLRARSTIDLIAALAMIATAGVMISAKFGRPAPPPPPPPPTSTSGTKPPPPQSLPAASQPLSNAAVKGSENARVGIIEYADFECPACAGFVRTTYPKLMTTYVETGRARFVFRHFPLPNHQFARVTAIGAHCAAEQGKFWTFYEHVYRLQPRLDEAGRQAAARKVGLDMSRWSRCVVEDRVSDVVDADFEAGRELELRGTPTFLIGTIHADGRLRVTARLYGAQGIDAFETAIAGAEKALLQAR